MNYIVVCLLIAVVWCSVKLIFEVLSEVIFCRLHKADWYAVLTGKKITNKKNNVKTDTNRIGFDYSEKTES